MPSRFHLHLSMLCAVALLVTACGGGLTSSDASSTAKATANATAAAQRATPALALAVSSTRSTTGIAGASDNTSDDVVWTNCATENGTCTFSGLRQVRYGTPTAYVTRDAQGSESCDNGTFGDPAVGIVKSCSYSSVAWTPCAVEGSACSFAGTGDVRYGSVDRYIVKSESDGVDCSNATFGDPIVGTVKSCWILAAATASPAGDPCESLPALPTVPADANVVTSFCTGGHCAVPDDGLDATDAIDLALDRSAGKFLVFPPGKYLISRSLRIKQRGVTLWGPGATIHATNADDQSIIVENDNASIYAFRLTAVTHERGSRVEHTRIAIYGPASVHPVVSNTIIRNNTIVNAGDPGTELANSATAAGIFVNAADGFLVAGNTVVRSLADGIHVTGGARNGRILGNTVRETGDDMIAMVSYAYPDPNANVAATIAGDFPASIDRYQDRNILVAGNTLSAQYWGRGIAIVGGRDITVRGNTLRNLPYGAAVLLARETQSGSYGVRNIVVESNTISDVQTLGPTYDFESKFATHGRTGHGAIEVEGSMFVDELAFPAMVDGFAVTQLAIRNNTVTTSATPGVRVGVGTGATWTQSSRPVTGTSPMSQIAISGNALAAIRSSTPIQILSGASVATCLANTVDGSALSVPSCSPLAATVAATGASLTCTAP